MLLHVDHGCLPPFVPERSRVLILGSFPSVESRRQAFYYAHKTNRFFPALAKAFQEETPISIPERKAFLVKHRIALYDVLFSCDIEKSKDDTIENPTPIDLESILSKAPIRAIFTTGKKAETLFRQFFDEDFIPLPSSSSANARMSLEELATIYADKILPFLEESASVC